jgi:4-methyl-5(b-hydroxyethyl)-thiazole monophosphate biosynthesis
MKGNVLLLLHPGFEEMEAIVPVDILRRSNVSVRTAAVGRSRKVRGAHGVEMVADDRLSTITDGTVFGALVVPGGPGIFRLRKNQKLLQCLRHFAHRGAWVGAICAAPLLLKDAGILPPNYTAHPSVKDELPQLRADPVVEDGNFLTSSGPGTVFEFSWALVERLRSKEVALAVAESMCCKRMS